MKRLDIALLFGVIAAVLITSVTSFAADCGQVRQNVVRLHILANSDSDEDQALKLAVRDAILLQTADIFAGSGNKRQAEQLADESLAQIEYIARQEINKHGYAYPVRAELVNMFFETRTYEAVTLPAGRYDAVRITIGQAKGKNWWCVLFPPLCIPAAGERPELPEQQAIERLGETPRYVPKLAVVELFEELTQDKQTKKPVAP